MHCADTFELIRSQHLSKGLAVLLKPHPCERQSGVAKTFDVFKVPALYYGVAHCLQ